MGFCISVSYELLLAFTGCIRKVYFRHDKTSLVNDSNSVQAGDEGAYSKIVWPATAASANAIRWEISVFRMGMSRLIRASRNCFPNVVLPTLREISNRAFSYGFTSY